MNASVIVSTFGDPSWIGLAEERAIPSAQQQSLEAQVIHSHGETLHEARNAGAAEALGDFLIFLDADDELDPRYVEKMMDSAKSAFFRSDRRTFLFQPATAGVHPDGRVEEPVLIPEKPLMDGNFMVIGTMVERELFEKVGGFRDLPIYEDYDLWIRCWLEGAGVVQVPEAVYRVFVRGNSRNNQSREIQVRTYNAIRERYFLAARQKGLA